MTNERPGAVTMTIATRNRADRLESLLRRLGRQTLPRDRFEVLVVVDGSTDASAAIARELEVPYELRVIEQEPSGLAVARNRGAREARHPLVVFFDDDIVPVDGLLAAHLAAHEGASAPRVVLGPYPPAGVPDNHWGRRQAMWWSDHFRRKAEPGHVWTFVDYVDGNTSLDRRELERVGGYDESFRGGRRQDWELGVRLLGAGWEFVNCDSARGDHHFDASFETAARVGREEGRLDVQLVRIHPETRRQLPIGWVASQLLLKRGAREAIASRVLARPLAWTPYLETLERFGSVRAWNSLANRLLVRAYVAGVRDALPGASELRSFLEWAAGREGLSPAPVLDLESESGLEPRTPVAPVEVEARRGDARLGVHRIVVPSENWDWEAVVERLTYGIAEERT